MIFATYANAMRNYATFSGRASRSEYWTYSLVFLGLMLGALILETILRIGSEDFRPLMGLVSVAHIVPNLAITSRRLHDQNRSSWWLLVLLTGIGGLVIFVMMFLPSDPSENRYGPAVEDFYDDDESVDLSRGASGRASVADEIERLAQLRADGIITQDEFMNLKSRLLGNQA